MSLYGKTITFNKNLSLPSQSMHFWREDEADIIVYNGKLFKYLGMSDSLLTLADSNGNATYLYDTDEGGWRTENYVSLTFIAEPDDYYPTENDVMNWVSANTDYSDNDVILAVKKTELTAVSRAIRSKVKSKNLFDPFTRKAPLDADKEYVFSFESTKNGQVSLGYEFASDPSEMNTMVFTSCVAGQRYSHVFRQSTDDTIRIYSSNDAINCQFENGPEATDYEDPVRFVFPQEFVENIDTFELNKWEEMILSYPSSNRSVSGKTFLNLGSIGSLKAIRKNMVIRNYSNMQVYLGSDGTRLYAYAYNTSSSSATLQADTIEISFDTATS